MAKEKVTKEIAVKDVEAWLDHKKISDRDREAKKEHIEILIDGLIDGTLTLDTESFVFTQHLKFPFENEQPLTELKYKPRVKAKVIQMHCQGLKPGDNMGQLFGVTAALTGYTKALISEMDTADTGIATAIAIFFI